MNLIQKQFNNNQTQTMSSREIATLTGKEHFNVVIDIKKMFKELEIDILSFQAIYLDNMNREQTEYLLDKENTLILVSGYSVKLRQAIIRRWQELENQTPALKLPATYIEALEALVISEKEKQLALETVKQLEITNNNLITVVDALSDWASIIRIAKHNKVSEKVFNWRLLKHKSADLGYEIKQVPSARYNKQNLYHLNVFRACYPEYDYDLNREVITTN